jgi:peptide/nickel transport system substrate-binding protein
MKEQKKLEEKLFHGRISRREFLTRVSALGLTVAVSPALLTKQAGAVVPKKGGRLRIGITGGQTTDTLDTATITGLMMSFLSFQIRNNLVEIDHKSNAIPELAESWEPSRDAKKWVFKLRKGVQFHNGKTMLAEDVIFSINHHRKEESKSAAKSLLTPIKDIKADGKYAVIFDLHDGNADFPFILSDYHLGIVPNGTADFSDGMGTGGYKLVDFEPGVRAVAKRNPNYWKEGRAHFDEVETSNIADVVARTSALKTGQLDVIQQLDLKTVHLLKKSPGVQVIEVIGTAHTTIPMLTDLSPYDNNNVRLALKHAIDREQVLKTVYRGHGMVGNDHPITPANRYYASDLPTREYDPDKARHYIKKAGLEDHTFNLHAADVVFPGTVDIALLYKEHAAKAGININVVREPNDGYWSNVWMKKDWCFSYWYGRPAEDWMFSTTYAEGASWNEAHWKHERFNKLLKEARAELNEAKRREMYVEMQRIVRDEGGSVIPLYLSYLFAATEKLKYENVSSIFDLDGARLAERWWFES